MPRPEKVQAVADIKEWLQSAQAVFVTEYRGLSVKQLADLRRRLRKTGAEYRVVKMTLAKRAAKELGLDALDQELTGPTALTFAHHDAVATAKTLRDFAREADRLVLKGAMLGPVVLAPEQVSRLADIEPREVLLARIAGGLQAPVTKAAGLLASFTRNAASMFGQLLEKKAAA
jgi:large subunit ribosomal protein L10